MSTADCTARRGRAGPRRSARARRGLRRRGPAALIVLVAIVLAYALPLLDSRRSSRTAGLRLRRRAVRPSRRTSLVALGLNIVVGYAGLLDLGYVGFYAIGAYTVGVLDLASTRTGRSCWSRCPSRSPSRWSPACILGAPTLRVRGDYLAIVTLGFGEIIRLTARQHRLARRRAGHHRHPAPAEHRARSRSRTSTGAAGRRSSTSARPTPFLSSACATTIPYYWLAAHGAS